jgi:hypothetical protein
VINEERVKRVQGDRITRRIDLIDPYPNNIMSPDLHSLCAGQSYIGGLC